MAETESSMVQESHPPGPVLFERMFCVYVSLALQKCECRRMTPCSLSLPREVDDVTVGAWPLGHPTQHRP